MSIKIIDEPGNKKRAFKAMACISATELPVALSEAGIKRVADTLAKQIIAENGN
jgi:hypothetical protein